MSLTNPTNHSADGAEKNLNAATNSELLDWIDWCISQDITFSRDGENINVFADPEALTPEVISQIKSYKPALLAWLKTQEAAIDRFVVKSVQPVARTEKMPLSFAQQRFWFIDLLEEGSSQYNIATSVALDGAFNGAVVEQVVNTIVERHEVLRTVYGGDNGVGYQHVTQLVADSDKDGAKVRVASVDLTHLSGEEQVLEVSRLVKIEAEKPFNLASDLMIRVGLLCLGEKRHQLLVTVHHIAADGWSMGLLVKEFIILFEAWKTGEKPKLPELSVQYADFAHWQRQQMDEAHVAKRLSYWKNHLAGVPRLHNLPLDKPRPARQQFSGDTYRCILDASLLDELNQLAQRQEATLFMLLQSTFALLIARYSNEKDVVIGSPIAGRTTPEVQNLIGCFLNNMVLRTKFGDQQTFAQLLAQSKENTLEAFSDQLLPFEMLVDAVQPERSLSHSPLFQIVFVLQNVQGSELELSELVASSEGKHTIKYDLELAASEQPDGLVLDWIFADSLFEQASIKKLANSFERLLRSVVANPDANIYELELLTDGDHQLISDSNKTTCIATDSATSLAQLVELQVRLNPHVIAIVDGGRQLSYSQLHDKVLRLSAYLCDQGCGVGEHIGICLENSLEMVIAIVAVNRIGGVYVPIEQSYPQQRIQYLLDDAAIDLVLLNKRSMAVVPLAGLDVLMMDDAFDADWMADYAGDERGAISSNENALVYILYTSGTTGQPKGVKIKQKGLINYLLHARDSYLNDNIKGSVLSSPLCFDATLTTLLTPLVAGKQLHILSLDQQAMLEGLSHYLFEQGHNWLFKLTPAHLDMLAGFTATGTCSQAEHKLVIGGERLSNDTLLRWKADLLPKSVFVNEYGPTETVVGCCIYEVSSLADLTPRSQSVAIGKPIRNTQLYVLDQQQRYVPIGAVGELYIGGEGVADGYLNRDEQTAAAFVELQINKSANASVQRFYRTGDLVRYRTDGELEFLGRLDNQLKIRGFRIEINEIQQLLLQQNTVKNAVIAVKGEGNDRRLLAYVVASQHGELSEAEEQQLINELKQVLRLNLPEYMLPASLMILATLPLTINGKVDVGALPEPGKCVSGAMIKPQTPSEEVLLRIWQQLLAIEEISTDANFFELGGHSLLAIRLVTAVNDHFVCQIRLKDVFEMKNIQALALHIDFLNTDFDNPEMPAKDELHTRQRTEQHEMEW